MPTRIRALGMRREGFELFSIFAVVAHGALNGKYTRPHATVSVGDLGFCNAA